MAQRHRYNFAQTHIGLQGDVLMGTTDAPAFGAGRLVFGGSHFWHLADFYISVPLTTFATQHTPWQYSEGVVTGGRYLPFGPGKGIPHPFIGLSWMTPRLQIGEGPEWQRSRLGLEAGLSLVVRKRYTIEARIQYQYRAGLDYPTSRGSTTPLLTPPWTAGVAVKKFFDFTAGNASEAGKAWREAAEQALTAHNAFSGWSVGIGLSANLVIAGFHFSDAPFLPDRPPIPLHPDVAVGYYSHPADAAVRLSYRPMVLSQSGYGYAYRLREHRLAVEGIKFLFDFHGFVPFMGVGLGATHQILRVDDRHLPQETFRRWMPSAALVFGWDIRPSRSDHLLLRTNLRLTAPTGMELESLHVRSTHLEINFIQLVIYPGRIAALSNLTP